MADIVQYLHYSDVIMGAIASQITSLTIVYSIVCSDADQWKHQIPRTNGQLREKCFHLMTSSWFCPEYLLTWSVIKTYLDNITIQQLRDTETKCTSLETVM